MTTIIHCQTAAERALCFDLRRLVFIEEQGIDESEEWDNLDASAEHFALISNGKALATARLIPRGRDAKIGRVAVARSSRGTGLGADLMRALIDHAREAGFERAVLESQLTAIRFYERLGFVAEGPEYDDGSGILHRLMVRDL